MGVWSYSLFSELLNSLFNFLAPKVTIVDTPGFGDNTENEEQTIDELVDVLKNEIKYVHVFLIAFNGESPRMTDGLRSMIRLFEKMFGNLFWENTMLEVTKWGFDAGSEKDRKAKDTSEEKWQDDWNEFFHEEFTISVS